MILREFYGQIHFHFYGKIGECCTIVVILRGVLCESLQSGRSFYHMIKKFDHR